LLVAKYHVEVKNPGGKMTETEKKSWQAFQGVVEVFLRKNKDLNYKQIAKTLITT